MELKELGPRFFIKKARHTPYHVLTPIRICKFKNEHKNLLVAASRGNAERSDQESFLFVAITFVCLQVTQVSIWLFLSRDEKVTLVVNDSYLVYSLFSDFSFYQSL